MNGRACAVGGTILLLNNKTYIVQSGHHHLFPSSIFEPQQRPQLARVGDGSYQLHIASNSKRYQTREINASSLFQRLGSDFRAL